MEQNSMFLVSRCMVHALYTSEVRQGSNQFAKDLGTEGWKNEEKRKKALRCKEFCEWSTEVGKHTQLLFFKESEQVGLSGAALLNWLNKNVLCAHYVSRLW